MSKKLRRKPSTWSRTFGKRGQTVTVYERTSGGSIYARVFDPGKRRDGVFPYRKFSLAKLFNMNEVTKEEAELWAQQAALSLARGISEIQHGMPNLDRVLTLYLKHATPKKGLNRQKHDQRCAAMWRRVLGADYDMSLMDSETWEAFVSDRASGAIDPNGNRVSEEDRRPVRVRTVVVDIDWLRAVIRWGNGWRIEGRTLLTSDPTKGLAKPRVKDKGYKGLQGGVRREFATTDRYEALRQVAGDVSMTVNWGGKTHEIASYLPELLELAWYTGRRIRAICALTYADLMLDGGEHGSIKWPGETDKQGEEHVMELHPILRAAVDRILASRPGIGKAPLFPAPKDLSRPLDTKRATRWLIRAERLAGLPKQDGSAWHAYRRGWATARQHFPDAAVARAGGWKTTQALKLCYQHATDADVRDVLMADVELRETH